MKKIFIPILASAALAPTIAVVSCGTKYNNQNVDQADKEVGNFLYDPYAFNKHELNFNFKIDYALWDTWGLEGNPKGEFKIRKEHSRTETGDYSFVSEKDTQIYQNGKLIPQNKWTWEDEYNFKINDTEIISQLRSYIIEVKVKVRYNGASIKNPPQFWFEAY